jgi:hypothetical protein
MDRDTLTGVYVVRSDCEFRQRYLAALDLAGPKRKAARRKALDVAHDIRKFEIGLCWTRSQYFWAFQVAVFAALGLSTSDDPGLGSDLFDHIGDIMRKIVTFTISLSGLLSSLAWNLVTGGSKRWQDNWERHVDVVEADLRI